ncbi:MAG: hypothetical protein ACHQ2F_01130 [Desulfobaccales bacterium]
MRIINHMLVTNQDLQRMFNFSPGQIRRWAVLILGKDPASPQSGGVSRKYDRDDAFLIVLLGMLISEYNIGQKEALEHIAIIGHKLKMVGLLPSRYKDTIAELCDLYDANWWMPIYLTIFPGKNYRLEIKLKYQKSVEDGIIKRNEEILRKEFTSDEKEFYKSPFGPEYTLHLSMLMTWFNSDIRSSG